MGGGEYQSDPFPHAVIRGYWPDYLIDECKRSLDSIAKWGERSHTNRVQSKWYCSDLHLLPSPAVRIIKEASSAEFLRWLEELTGESGLLPDPYLKGGGVHRIGRGGFLGMHTDFNYHEQLGLYRRLNLLLYLNRDWQDEWGGHLELGPKKIAPEANTMVVFTTDDKSVHGHPHPLQCPEGVYRDSIALYYYSAHKPDGFVMHTNTDYR